MWLRAHYTLMTWGGRTDLIGEFDEKLSVIDYKTSRKRKTWEMCHGYFNPGPFLGHL